MTIATVGARKNTLFAVQRIYYAGKYSIHYGPSRRIYNAGNSLGKYLLTLIFL
jgi:hypothetical protein